MFDQRPKNDVGDISDKEKVKEKREYVPGSQGLQVWKS